MSQTFEKRAKRSYQAGVEQLRRWKAAHPDLLTTTVIGKSDSRDIHRVKITDTSVPAAGKQRVLLTAMHAGCEYSGANVLFDLIDFLVSDEASARAIRATQEVHVVPIVNVFAYESPVEELMKNQYRNAFGRDPYQGSHWTIEGVREVDRNPEAAAIQQLIDELQPELMIDCHGVFYAHQLMVDQTGLSVHGLGRAHHGEFVRRMIRAAEEEGYAMDYEDDRQRILPVANESLSGYLNRYQTCSPQVTANSYAHHHYHTLAFTIEVSDEGSGLGRLRKALAMGNEVWALDNQAGYPVEKIWGEGLYDVCARGTNHGERRDSRVELWQRLAQMSVVTFGPQMPGRFTLAVSWHREVAAELGRLLRRTPGEVLARLAGYEAIPGDIAEHYGSNELHTCPGYLIGQGGEDHALRHGVAFRIKIPFARAKVHRVMINDRVVRPTAESGGEIYPSRNFTVVKVEVPPAESNRTFHLLDVIYDPE